MKKELIDQIKVDMNKIYNEIQAERLLNINLHEKVDKYIENNLLSIISYTLTNNQQLIKNEISKTIQKLLTEEFKEQIINFIQKKLNGGKK